MPSERPWTPGLWSCMFDANGIGRIVVNDVTEKPSYLGGQIANMRLCAAAPELYEALDRLGEAASIVLLLDIQGVMEGREAAMAELNMATFNAQAALEKATPVSKTEGGKV